MQENLISVGIPTRNRGHLLCRAVDSVLSQDYRALELIVSDNASTDGTADRCAVYALADRRFRYLRQHKLLPAAENFLAAHEHASGRYFMWLGDDDWLGPGYLAQCAAALNCRANHSGLVGVVRYYRGGTLVEAPWAVPIALLAQSGEARVLEYYERVTDNGGFYGLYRRELLNRSALREAFGGDWVFVAGLAFLGRIETLGSVELHRSLEGTSADVARLARELEGSGFWGRHPWLSLALGAACDVMWRGTAYRSLSPARRVRLGLRVYRVLCRRRGTGLGAALRSEVRLRTRIRGALSFLAAQVARGAKRWLPGRDVSR